MIKYKGSFLLVLMALAISSCKNDLESLEGGHHRGLRTKHQPKVKTISMSFGGDYITESEEPLLRAEGDGDTFVGINVFYKKDGDTDDKQPYAYGLFDKTDGIRINLLTGYTYRFEATILIERDDKLDAEDYNQQLIYGMPFHTSNGNNTGFYKSNMRDFIYFYDKEADERFYFTELDKGTASVDSGEEYGSMYRKQDLKYPRVKRFYGTAENIVISEEETPNIVIPMDYKSFGLKFNLVSIPENTSVTVMDVTESGTDVELQLRFPNEFSLNSSSETSKSWESIYSLNDFTQDTHQFTLKFTWDKGHAESETFVHTFTAQAKKKTVLNITIDGDVSQTKSGNITFNPLDDTLTDSEVEVTNKK